MLKKKKKASNIKRVDLPLLFEYKALNLHIR